MKRLQISIEPELDQELGRVAAAEGVSKAEIVRRYLRDNFSAMGAIEDDPVVRLFGRAEGGEPGDSEDHDAVIYPG